MADKKISELNPAGTPLVGTELLPIVQDGATRKVQVSSLVQLTVANDAAVKLISALMFGAL